MKKESFKRDLYRFYGNQKPTILQRFFKPYELRYIKWYRYCQSHEKSLVGRYFLRNISKKTHIQIPPQVAIMGGFFILHFGRIVINHHVKAGYNFTINPGILIGQEERGKRRGSPSFGNCVYIGQNAVVVGDVSIGDDVLIAPNAYVNFDVPSHSVVIGNPGKIIHKENATAFYIKNPLSR